MALDSIYRTPASKGMPLLAFGKKTTFDLTFLYVASIVLLYPFMRRSACKYGYLTKTTHTFAIHNALYIPQSRDSGFSGWPHREGLDKDLDIARRKDCYLGGEGCPSAPKPLLCLLDVF